MTQIYCDGVEEVSITGGVVRVDFFHYKPGARDEDGKPAREHSFRLCLSPEAFVQAYGSFDQVVKQLQERGLVNRRDTSPAPAADPVRARGSANF